MGLVSVDFQSVNAAKVFTDSLHTIGFGVIHNHPISMQLIDEVSKEWLDFFRSKDVEKQKYLFDKKNHDGFFPLDISEMPFGASVLDIKEYYHYYPWGRAPETISDKTQELFDALLVFAETLLGWIEEYTPVEISKQFSMPLSKMVSDSPKTLLRILHYPPLTGEEVDGAVRAAEHTDLNMLTILPAAREGGLQAKQLNGEWAEIDPDSNAIVINIADMLQMCTQGYYRSSPHRVINPIGMAAKRSRISMPLFLHARSEVQLNEQYTAQAYWDKRLKELAVV